MINDTINYESLKLQSPIEHVVITENKDPKLQIVPRAVYSDDVKIDYFGFSKGIKTFSTYYNNNLNKTNVGIEYIYDAKHLIKSFSDFRDEASYENITYNFNTFNWTFKNENSNKEIQKLKIEMFFDLGDIFINETTQFSINMTKSMLIASITEEDPDYKFIYNTNKTIVKFETEKNVKFNETVVFNVKFPLYFENCKNYKLNSLVVITGFVFLAFFLIVIYMVVSLIFNEEIN